MANIQYKKPGKVIAINIVITLLLLVLIDLLARLFVEPHEFIMFSDRTDVIRGRPFVAEDNKIGFLLVPNYQSDDVNINSKGFRGEEIKYDLKDNYVILAIGGSATFGWGVDDRYTYPYQLEKRLNANALLGESPLNISVINAGIPSFTSTQQKLYLDRILTEISPNLVLVMTGINDYHYSLLSNWYPEVLLLRTPSPWRLWLTNNSALFKLFAARNPKHDNLVNVFNNDALKVFRSNIEEMIEISAAHNTEIIAIAPPINEDGYPDGQFSPFSETIHTGEYIIQSQRRFWNSQVEAFNQAKQITIEHSMSVTQKTDSKYFLDYCHLTPEGNRILVSDIADQIAEIIHGQH